MDKILLLQSLPGFGLVRTKKFLSDNYLYLQDDDYFKELVQLETGFNIDNFYDNVKRIKEDCNRLGVNIINTKDLKIINKPILLYVKGDKSLINRNRRLAVVGTREPNINTIEVGQKFVELAVKNNWVIISGLASGCDTLAHKKCISLNGSTIAVLPKGYHRGLAPWILENGLFVSEYPPNTNIEKYKCVNRNRIITGLSRGLFVMEAKKSSGTVHSLKNAYVENKPISFYCGYKGIEQYSTNKITTLLEFDLFLQNCIE